MALVGPSYRTNHAASVDAGAAVQADSEVLAAPTDDEIDPRAGRQHLRGPAALGDDDARLALARVGVAHLACTAVPSCDRPLSGGKPLTDDVRHPATRRRRNRDQRHAVRPETSLYGTGNCGADRAHAGEAARHVALPEVVPGAAASGYRPAGRTTLRRRRKEQAHGQQGQGHRAG